MTKLCIDLCSGLGGFSQAFVNAGWEVVTVDIDPKFNPTICKDVRSLTAQEIEKTTKLGSFKLYQKVIMLMSPPCTYFSIAAGMGAFRKGFADALTIVAGCIRLLKDIQPTGAILENPATSYLQWFLGKPNMRVKYNAWGYITVKPTAFWGNISIPFPKVPDSSSRNLTKNAWANFVSKSPSKRAQIPLRLSQAILESVSSE